MLIGTSDIRTWMGIDEGDKKPNSKLLMISQAIQDFVESYTNRQLEAKVYLNDPVYSYFDGTSKPYLYFPVYPVSYVSSVNIDNDRIFGSGTLVPSNNYFFYPNGKLMLDRLALSSFQNGRRNILINYTAGFAPVVGGTWNSSVSTYPLPNDLKQVMVEMCVESFKEGITAVHSIQANQQGGDPKFVQMLSKNSFWSNVLNGYKSFDQMFPDVDENQTKSKFDYNIWY